MVKPPFSKRQNPEQLEEFLALREGIPDGLRPSLLKWSRVAFLEETPWDTEEVNQARLELAERVINTVILPYKDRDDLDTLEIRLAANDELHLDVVEVSLRWVSDKGIEILKQLLTEARSAYCVGSDEDGNYELQFRQLEEMTELFQIEADQPGRAAEHLRRAWSKCFHRDRDLNTEPDSKKEPGYSKFRTLRPLWGEARS